ncbi:LysR family transcriptional regulator [Kiloniella majae]|uniref:LysR family transcriptional regulator n=1 Tax=Kiloniella majae TaxID=1938558 RepID=UPI000A2778CC|nr:LysR family transcriptional regulator [Kiloniella majae]
MDLNLFKVFDALIEEENASRAAVKLGISQSAVSAALGRLRGVYNDPLFVRVQGGLTPTSRAIEIKPHVQDVLNSVSKSLELSQADKAIGFIKLGMSDDIEIAYGAIIIKALREEFPEIRPIIKQSFSDVTATLLLDKSFDIAIGSGGLSNSRLQRQSVGQSCYLTISETPAANGSSFTREEFLEREHLLISSGGLVGAVDEALKVTGGRRKIAASTTHFATTDLLLAGTDYVATIPAHAARVLVQRSRLFLSDCPVPLKPYPIELAVSKTSLRDANLVRISDFISDLLRHLLKADTHLS